MTYGRDRFVDDRFDDPNNTYSVYGLVDWAVWRHANNHNRGLQFSSSTGYYVEFTYTGSVAKVYGLRSIDGGIGTVSVDGRVVGEIDFFSANGDQFQQEIYSTSQDVGPRTHSVKIAVAGRNNGNSQAWPIPCTSTRSSFNRVGQPHSGYRVRSARGVSSV